MNIYNLQSVTLIIKLIYTDVTTSHTGVAFDTAVYTAPLVISLLLSFVTTVSATCAVAANCPSA